MNSQVTSESFGVVDGKGREIGASAHSYELDFVEIENPGQWESYYTIAPGHYFVFRPSAERAGRAFGASHREQLFATAAERDAAVTKYLAGARKRAAKLAGK